ncbi:MAG: L,D-transpeptidase [Patescibacteria group bacterium]|jgi:lipoprotein-anchoring transpeptidase ErfK/SrfK
MFCARTFSLFLFAASMSISLFPRSIHAATTPDIRILDNEGNVITVFAPYSDSNALITSIATADLGNDGIAEILVGAGEDGDPSVSVFRQDGSFIGSFLAYDVAYRGGVNVASCDIDGDDVNEIITSAAWNGGPHVRIFNAMGVLENPGFFAFESSFMGGANIACGNLVGDEASEIVVSASLGGGPVVKVFNGFGNLLSETFIDDASKNTGAAIAIADIDHDSIDEVLTATMGYATPSVTAWSFDASSSSLVAVQTETSLTTSSSLIAPIGVDDVTGNILIATQGYVTPQIQSINNTQSFQPFSADATHAISASIIFEKGKQKGFVLANVAPKMNNDVAAKSIRIDKSQQRLTTYEYGVPMHTFFVSTAKKGYVTPVGKTEVREKLLYHDYVWVFGIGDPRNYNVPNVKWNLQIYDHIYIHWAYWHNNFGHPMSHGCVNANAENSEWIFDWSDVGTTVNIVE